MGRKLSGWKEKILSIGGREILIKAVARAISTYTMSCFQLPKGLCDEIESMTRRFWWGQRGQESKIAWVSWRKLCKSKLKAVWVSEISKCSILPCLQSKVGGSLRTQTH